MSPIKRRGTEILLIFPRIFGSISPWKADRIRYPAGRASTNRFAAKINLWQSRAFSKGQGPVPILSEPEKL
jgi:hypothetical protein